MAPRRPRLGPVPIQPLRKFNSPSKYPRSIVTGQLTVQEQGEPIRIRQQWFAMNLANAAACIQLHAILVYDGSVCIVNGREANGLPRTELTPM